MNLYAVDPLAFEEMFEIFVIRETLVKGKERPYSSLLKYFHVF